MTSFDKYLKEQLKNPAFKEFYKEEKELVELAFKLNEERRKRGETQSEVAKKAHLTQQQYSKIENGENCNILTYLKASKAIGYRLTLEPIRRSRRLANV
jgi:HTH-type transcriptional regulator / antitoxin HipB